MKKIIIITGNVSMIGGTERVAVLLANTFDSIENIKVEIVNLGIKNGEIKYKINSNVHIKFAEIASNHTSSLLSIALNALKSFFQFKKYIKNNITIEEETTVIAIGTLISYFLPFIFNKRKVKLIGTQHNPVRHSFLLDKFRKYVLRKLSYYIVLDKETERDMRGICDNIKIIPNPLTIKKVKENQVSSLNSKNVLAVGRLTSQKGFDLLINSWKIVNKEHPEWKLTIVGEGDDKGYLISLIEQLGLKNSITIQPFTTNILNYYLTSSIFVCSSRYEGFGLVILEAQNCGLPVVSFNCPTGPSNIINNNIDGLLVEVENINHLANNICSLIKNPEKMKEMGRNAFLNSQKFRINNIVDLWMEII